MDAHGNNLPPYELDSHQREALTDLFRIIDRNSDGYIDVDEFARFGRAMTGQIIDNETALWQLRRADADNDDHLSLDDWMLYGRFLARTPDFFAVVAALKRSLFALDRREGTAAVGDDLTGATLSGQSSTDADGISATAAATRAYQTEMHAVRIAADRGVTRKGRAAAMDAARMHAEEAAAIGAGAEPSSIRDAGSFEGAPKRAHVPLSARRRVEESNAAMGFTPRGSGHESGTPHRRGLDGKSMASDSVRSVPRLDLSVAKSGASGVGQGKGIAGAAPQGVSGEVSRHAYSGVAVVGARSPSGVASVDFG